MLSVLSGVSQNRSENVGEFTIGNDSNLANPSWQDEVEFAVFCFLVQLHRFDQLFTRHFGKTSRQSEFAKKRRLSFLTLLWPKIESNR